MGAFEMDNCPASGARPDLGFASNFFGTNTTFVVPGGDILLNPLPELRGRGLGDLLARSILLSVPCPISS